VLAIATLAQFVVGSLQSLLACFTWTGQMTWFEIFADESGIIIERKRDGWVFVPNKPVGRPRKRKQASDPLPKINEQGLESVLPKGVTIEHLRLVSA
jgi:hypothetical protein